MKLPWYDTIPRLYCSSAVEIIDILLYSQSQYNMIIVIIIVTCPNPGLLFVFLLWHIGQILLS